MQLFPTQHGNSPQNLGWAQSKPDFGWVGLGQLKFGLGLGQAKPESE